jgi:hypothetical protein
MKILILTTVLAGSLSGCMTETTRTITTDKAGTVTDTTVVKKGTDKATMELIGMAVEIYRPRPAVIVREEKADHDMRRLLRGWRGPAGVAVGPITKDEISNRYRRP